MIGAADRWTVGDITNRTFAAVNRERSKAGLEPVNRRQMASIFNQREAGRADNY